MRTIVMGIVLSVVLSVAQVNAELEDASDSLKGYTGVSQDNFPNQPAFLAGSGWNVSFVWAGGNAAYERINFNNKGASFGYVRNGTDSRNYLRTIEANYSSVNFTAYVTVERENRGTVYFGLGTGALGTSKIPDAGTTNACTFLNLQDNYGNASWRKNSNTEANVEVGWTPMQKVYGLMRLKMDYNAKAKTVTYSADYDYNGTFVADQVFATVDIATQFAEWQAGDRASIFFGGDNANWSNATLSQDTSANDGMTYTDFAVEGITGRGAARKPVPTNQNLTVDSTAVSAISWFSPEQDKNGNVKDDPNLVSIDNYAVYFYGISNAAIVADPNLAKPDFGGINPVNRGTSQLMNVTLNYDSTYFWRVDTTTTWNIRDIFDPNDYTDNGDGTVTVVTASPVWQFATLTQYLAPKLVMNNVMSTLDILPAALSASVTGNSEPVTSVAFTLLTDDAAFPTGAAALLTNTTTDKQNPTAELITNMAGTYKVKLVILDGKTSTETLAEVLVFADSCEAKKLSPGGWIANYYDRDNNCIVDLADFALLAANWLNDTGMMQQETYQRTPVYIKGGILIEAESAVLNACSNAPLNDSDGIRIENQTAASGRRAIGYADVNAWIEYQVDVPQAGTYVLQVGYALPTDSQTLSFGTAANPALFGSAILPATGAWTTFVTNNTSVVTFDSAGSQTVRITWSGGLNLDWFAIVPQ